MVDRVDIEKTERQTRHRSRRVALLIAGIVLLSLGDLLITLTYLRTTGMVEANPIAAWLIRTTGSTAALVAYKLLTVGVCVGLLHRLRRQVEGEVAAWCAVVILALAAVQWYQYTRHYEPAELMFAQGGAGWLVLD